MSSLLVSKSLPIAGYMLYNTLNFSQKRELEWNKIANGPHDISCVP